MLFKVSPDIFRQFPGATIGVVVAHNIANEQSSVQVKDLLQQSQDEVRKYLNPELVEQHPHIKAWLEAYKALKVNPKKYIPSVKNLSDRTLKKGMPSINNLVDIYNSVSLHYLLPAGGEDLDTIKGDIELAVAGDNEPTGLLLGDKEPSKPEPGEVIYKDAQGFICRRWNWKEADRTKLTPNTKHAILVLEGLPPVDPALIELASQELASLIEQYCGGSVSFAIVDAQHPEITIKRGNEWVQLQKPQKLQFPTAEQIYSKKSEAEPHIDTGSVQHRIRIEKVERMRAQGIDPWPAGREVNATAQEVSKEFDESKESREYQVAGRLMSFREHGKTIFGNIQDRTGRMQIYIRQEDIGQEKFEQFKEFFDIGDIIWVKGHSFKTKTGEITIKAQDVVMESKDLHPLPEKFHGLTDVETAYRQRYLDLISNPESRHRFVQRSLIVRTIRNFLDSYDFMEVETPMLQPFLAVQQRVRL